MSEPLDNSKITREEKLRDLKAAIGEGDKGPFIPLDFEEINREVEEEEASDEPENDCE